MYVLNEEKWATAWYFKQSGNRNYKMKRILTKILLHMHRIVLYKFKVWFLRMEMSHKSRKCLILVVLLSTIYWFDLLLGMKTHELAMFSLCRNLSKSHYADINFIQNHPSPLPRTNPMDTTWREQKPSPRDNHCVPKSSSWDRTGSQKPHPRDIKLENFTNISINSDTIWNKNLCCLNKYNGFLMWRLIIEVYIIWWSPESNYWTYKSFYKSSEKTLQKNISNFCRFNFF